VLGDEHKTRREMLKILVANISSCFFTYKCKRNEEDGRPAVATAATHNTPVLSTVFEVSPVVYQLLRSTMANLLQ
jgi:adenylyl- and sulfurtransferase ThiI